MASWWKKLGHTEVRVLGLLLLASLGIWAFIALAGEMQEGDTRAFDRTILLAMRSPGHPAEPWGPRWVEELARDYTSLGGVGVPALLTAVVAGYLILQHRRRAALFLVTAVGSGAAVSFLLKEIFARPRPTLVPHAVYVVTSSFPSGHSMLSAVMYLTLGALIARYQRAAVKVYVLSVAVLLTLVIGVSRVYLGVHWPTDVLAGWVAGAAWALLAYSVALWMQRYGTLDRRA